MSESLLCKLENVKPYSGIIPPHKKKKTLKELCTFLIIVLLLQSSPTLISGETRTGAGRSAIFNWEVFFYYRIEEGQTCTPRIICQR